MASIPLKELIKRFKKLGYTGPFSGGKHQFMVKQRQKIRIPNPHKNRDVDVSLIKEILRQAEIGWDEWEEVK